MPGLRILLTVRVVPVLVGAFVLLGRRGGPMLTQTRPLPKMKGSLDAPARRADVELGREILHLLETGRGPEAVSKLEGLKKRLG